MLVDLAMPGIDGWETIRRLRALPQVNAKVAIVSANAFDKGLDNDAGIRAEDFILKPVRHSDLLDWLERQLGLTWLDSEPPVPVAVAPKASAWEWPDEATLIALLGWGTESVLQTRPAPAACNSANASPTKS